MGRIISLRIDIGPSNLYIHTDFILCTYKYTTRIGQDHRAARRNTYCYMDTSTDRQPQTPHTAESTRLTFGRLRVVLTLRRLSTAYLTLHRYLLPGLGSRGSRPLAKSGSTRVAYRYAQEYTTATAARMAGSYRPLLRATY